MSTAAPGSKPLKNKKREAFCQEYIVDKNQTAAAKRAGYSAKTAEQIGHQLLKETSVRDRVDFLLAAQQQRTEITADRVLKELGRIAFLDFSQAYGEDGKLLHPKDMPEEIRRAVAGIDVFEEFEGYGEDRQYIGDTKTLKLYDKVAALKLLGQHFKLFIQKIEVDVTDQLADRLAAARRRVAQKK